jgi:hypothetical protein
MRRQTVVSAMAGSRFVSSPLIHRQLALGKLIHLSDRRRRIRRHHMGRRPSDQEPRQADNHNPRVHCARPVPPPWRVDCAARGELAGRRPVLHGVCPDQHHRCQREQDTCDGFVPRCVQGDRPRDPVQLVHGLQDVHKPWSFGVQVLGWVESWSGV